MVKITFTTCLSILSYSAGFASTIEELQKPSIRAKLSCRKPLSTKQIFNDRAIWSFVALAAVGKVYKRVAN